MRRRPPRVVDLRSNCEPGRPDPGINGCVSAPHQPGEPLGGPQQHVDPWVPLEQPIDDPPAGPHDLTEALLDRFTHRCHIFAMNGESFRFRESSKQAREKKTKSA